MIGLSSATGSSIISSSGTTFLSCSGSSISISSLISCVGAAGSDLFRAMPDFEILSSVFVNLVRLKGSVSVKILGFEILIL